MIHWDAHKYEEWFNTPAGHVALDCEAWLLQAVVAGWPRRGKKLLEVGCGTGIFLEMLWQMGLDVTGVDQSDEMLGGARKRLGNRADLHCANGELLPFEDNEFDYVLLWSVLEFAIDPKQMLAEASRVAKRGILIGFLNRQSLYYWFNVRKSTGTMSKANLKSWFEVNRMVKEASGFNPCSGFSVLPGPLRTWREGLPWKLANNRLYPPWLGAFSALRVDFVDFKPLTPLLAWRSRPEMSS